MITPAIGTCWRHRKRGTVYVVDSVVTGQGDGIEGVAVVVYTGAARDYWCRRLDEFLARFVQVSPQDGQPL